MTKKNIELRAQEELISSKENIDNEQRTISYEEYDINFNNDNKINNINENELIFLEKKDKNDE